MSSTISQAGDNIYVNVNFSSGDVTNSSPIYAVYRVTKTIPILGKCDDYYCSVIRFDIPLSTIPLIIFPVIPGSQSNFSPMRIGIFTGGLTYTFNLIYVPDNNYMQPIQNDPNNQIITRYYFVYNYENLILSINTALSKAYVASGLSALGHEYPYFFYDSVTGLINLIVDQRDFAPTATPGVPQPVPLATIYFNEYLQYYLTAFPSKYIGDIVTGREYELNLVNYGTYNLKLNNVPTFTNNQKVFTQNYQTIGKTGALKKILIATTSIPIISEYTPTNNSGISSIFPIISDFTPQLESPGEGRSVAYFTPSSQYRLCDLKSSTELNTIDLRIYWTDRFENLYPLELSVFEQASIKLGFFKKSLYNSNSTLLLKK